MNDLLLSPTNLGLTAEFTRDLDSEFLCVVPNRKIGETLLVNLQSLHGDSVAYLPDWDLRPNKIDLPAENVQEHRLETIHKIKEKKIQGLIVPVKAFGVPVLSPPELPSFEINVGDTPGPIKVTRQLSNLGFTRQPLVEKPGDFALRGDLLDFYPESLPYPIRVSFFDQEIESVDYFHPNTQHRAGDLPPSPLTLTLQSEFALTHKEIEDLQHNLRSASHTEEADVLDYDHEPEEMPGWYGLWPRETTAIETLLPNPTTLIYNPMRCWEKIEEWDDALSELDNRDVRLNSFRSLEEPISALSKGGVVLSPHEADNPLTHSRQSQTFGEPLDVSGAFSLETRPINEFIKQIDTLTGTVDLLDVHCGEQGFKDRLQELLEEQLGSAEQISGTRIQLHDSPWKGSYRIDSRASISLDDFFNRTISRGRIGPSRGKTEYLSSFEELNPGDMVVHEQFGIGRFMGLKRINTEKQTRDCIYIQYSGDDKLYLPPDQIAWIQKYIADSGFEPSLSSLTSDRWQQIKRGVEEDVDELAEELLDLYMSRSDSKTKPFPADNLEQKQFEASFPYRETPDQLEAIEQVKSDMRDEQPMNRLICGDSGFGKTEIALRAAFKAVSSGRQVAMLIPTTVLARQHYETFSHRFSIFPYNVEMLSRFNSTSETESIIAGLKNGNTDVVIGTHRLLSKDIDFKNLGLLIIDEEQRFGVRQKEALKFYRSNVDVLTLSATPIPRTLYMSLSGIQDISQINTPPEDRVPIEINVGAYQADIARDALQHELSRGGQVFWIHNRVKGIESEVEYVRSLLEENHTVDFAHGQMGKDELSTTMDRFYSGEIDVLVCTTIVEAGIDCPRVNTMVIRNAHRFGLAQLYQLRGRVGRSHEQAFAYMFYPGHIRLSDDAESRLTTIKQCAELGSGFQLAMRDLEIRGAGHLLGKRQHGNIRAVGFPFYCRLLQRSIRKLREDIELPQPFPRLDFPGEHYIPEDYIPLEKQVIKQYQALANCRQLKEVDSLETGWNETFGPIPEPVQELLVRHRFKIIVNREQIEDIRYKNNRLNMRTGTPPPDSFVKAAQELGCKTEQRVDRLMLNRMTPERLHHWLREVSLDQQLINA